MGMFDSIFLHEVLIPAIPELVQRSILIGAQDELQTKDLDCCLHEYHVGVDRKLMLRKAEYKTIDTPDNVIPSVFEETGHKMVHVDNTATVNCCFYRQGRRHGDEDVWVDLKLIFLRGVLDTVDVVDVKITPSTPRIVRMEQHAQEVITRAQDPWIQARRKLSIICGRIASFFNKLQYSLLS